MLIKNGVTLIPAVAAFVFPFVALVKLFGKNPIQAFNFAIALVKCPAEIMTTKGRANLHHASVNDSAPFVKIVIVPKIVHSKRG